MPTTKKIINSDGHVFEPQDIWLRYLEAPSRRFFFALQAGMTQQRLDSIRLSQWSCICPSVHLFSIAAAFLE